MNNTGIKLTYQDYLQITDDLNRHEIIDGEHYATPSPATRHQRISIRLSSMLYQWIENHSLGEVLSAPVDVVLSEVDVVVPDIVFVSRSRSSIVGDRSIQGAPDLIIEILSPSTASRDSGIKKRLYEKYGVKEYWILDPDQRTITVFNLIEGRFSETRRWTAKDDLTCNLLPGLRIPLSSIFVQ